MKIVRQVQLAGLTTLILFGCAYPDSGNQKPANTSYCLDEKFKQELTLEHPVMQPVTEGIPLTGVVEPNPDKVIHFVSLMGGIISNTYFSLGDKVAKGQVLAELRSAELSSLQAELNSLESQLKVAENKLQSTQSMFSDGISSQKDLTGAQSELDILKSEKLKVSDKTINELAFLVADAAQEYIALATELGILKPHSLRQSISNLSFDNSFVKEQKQLADLGLDEFAKNLFN